MLSDSSKALRRRRVILNIHITFLGWLVELLGFWMLIFGSFILGHGNNTATMCLQIFTMIIYIIILPCTILVNTSDVKNSIMDSNWYLAFINYFGCQNVNSSSLADKDKGSIIGVDSVKKTDMKNDMDEELTHNIPEDSQNQMNVQVQDGYNDITHKDAQQEKHLHASDQAERQQDLHAMDVIDIEKNDII